MLRMKGVLANLMQMVEKDLQRMMEDEEEENEEEEEKEEESTSPHVDDAGKKTHCRHRVSCL